MIIQFIKLRKDAQVPIRASDGAVGYDVFASRILDKKTKRVIGHLPLEGDQKELLFDTTKGFLPGRNNPGWILPGESLLVGIGVAMAVPWGIQCEVRPRSGLASRLDIELSNSPGTIDPDYRGEAGVLLRNRGSRPFKITHNMRIAQLVFSRFEVPVFEEVKKLPRTVRGIRGFGGTGLFGTGLGTDEYDAQIRELDTYYMKVVRAIAERSTCVRGVKRINGKFERDAGGRLVGQTRRFGCVIVQEDNIVAQGFNDQYPGAEKCSKIGCLREKLKIKSGTQLEKCRAMHAEWWALTNLVRRKSAVGVQGATMYINAEPCEICAKLIAGAGIETVVILKGVYPQNGTKILQEAGVNIRYVEINS